jgi:hypothetical protein
MFLNSPNAFIRPDLIFTYWIYVWFLAYVVASQLAGPKDASSIRSESLPKDALVPNPAFALLIGILENVFTIGYMLWIGAPRIGWFVAAVVVTKVVPFWYVYEPARLFSSTPIKDTVILFAMYTAYLLVLGTNPIEVYKQILKSFEQDRIRTPFYYVMNLLSK